eukprot:SAG25_NODE_1983_length_2060_cov_1.345232_2_plen_374_part_00
MRRASALAATTATTATMYIQLQVHRCRSQLQKETAQRQVDDQMAGLPVPACDAACDQIQQTNQRCARVELALGYAARPVKRRGALPRRLTIATQNIMDGCCLDSLIDEMLESQVVDVVDVLCVQENVITPRGKGGHHAGRLAWHLNHCCRSTERLQDGTDSDGSVDNLLCTRRQYHCHYHPEAPRLATVYDASQLDVVHSVLIRLPVLSPIPCAQRPLLYLVPRLAEYWPRTTRCPRCLCRWHSRLIFSARAEPKHAILTVMRPRSNACVHGDDGATTVKSLGSVPEDIVVVNFHLDAMGDNEHRKNQVRWLVTELIRLGFASSAPSVVTGSHQLVLCGDTNIFAVGRKSQREALRDACTPLLEYATTLIPVC